MLQVSEELWFLLISLQLQFLWEGVLSLLLNLRFEEEIILKLIFVERNMCVPETVTIYLVSLTLQLSSYKTEVNQYMG